MEMKRPRGGGPHSSAEPDVCRALTGVAAKAALERGELLGAGSPRWDGGREGVGPADPKDGVLLGRTPADPRGGRGRIGPGGPTFGCLRSCPTVVPAPEDSPFRCFLPALRWAEARPLAVRSKLVGRRSFSDVIYRSTEERSGGSSTLPLTRQRFHLTFLIYEMR